MESRVGLAAGENALNTCGMQASILVRQGALRSARELLVECNPDGLAATANRWRQGYAEVLFATGDLAGANEVVASLREKRTAVGRKHAWLRLWVFSVLLPDRVGSKHARGKMHPG